MDSSRSKAYDALTTSSNPEQGRQNHDRFGLPDHVATVKLTVRSVDFVHLKRENEAYDDAIP